MTGDRQLIADLTAAEGIHYWGVTDAQPAAHELEHSNSARREYREWISQGRHGTMEFLAAHEKMKYDPGAIVPGAQSVIVFALSYYPGRRTGEAKRNPLTAELREDRGGSAEGKISMYARGRDYHKEFGRRIKRIAAELRRRYPGEGFRGFTDTAPLQERWYAQKAGMTFTGRNTLSLHREMGSYFFLGEIISTLAFEPTDIQSEAMSHCPRGCTRCIDVCPTAALEAPYRINASTCISYLTIEHKGMIKPELMEKMGTWLFGCDLCQDVCPFNIRAKVSDVAAFINPINAGRVDLADLLGMEGHDDFTRRFAGTAVMRTGWRGMLRNALIAAANGGHTELLPRIARLCSHADAVVSATARWAEGKLKPSG